MVIHVWQKELSMIKAAKNWRRAKPVTRRLQANGQEGGYGQV
jgi:hypothetical protein